MSSSHKIFKCSTFCDTCKDMENTSRRCYMSIYINRTKSLHDKIPLIMEIHRIMLNPVIYPNELHLYDIAKEIVKLLDKEEIKSVLKNGSDKIGHKDLLIMMYDFIESVDEAEIIS